jgi:hypothetical protein
MWPIGEGHVPMIALKDIGWWARYVFDAPRKDVNARELEIASEMVAWPHLVETFTRVTGLPAVYIPLTIDQWMDITPDSSRPLAVDHIKAGITSGVTTWRQNFSCLWRAWRNDIVTRDMAWIRSIHPGTRTLESWIREEGYIGEIKTVVLKGVEDQDSEHPWKKAAQGTDLPPAESA